MRGKKIMLTNFSRAHYSESTCIRPENELELEQFMAGNESHQSLARGAGLSYNDSCLNQDKSIVDTSRINHFIKFDLKSQLVTCQAGVTFSDLFLVHPEFIPPVIPGTLNATIGGGIAHDIHGKNNPSQGSLGHHIEWLELLINDTNYHCSRAHNVELFYATIGGLGLTGVIVRVAIRLKKATRFVSVKHTKYLSIDALLEAMAAEGLQYDYQVAWLDLLHDSPRALLSLANHSSTVALTPATPYAKPYTLPSLPFALVKPWNMALFNRIYFNKSQKPKELTLAQFNNPLDQINNWNKLYGRKGLIQFQAVFAQENASQIINALLHIIKEHKATPTLTVLKLFTQAGDGLLSFCQSGFTLAIDFIFNKQAKECISVMNQLITEHKGRIYLAKDILLTPEQFKIMYPKHQNWLNTVRKYQCHMHSDLASRLGIMS